LAEKLPCLIKLEISYCEQLVASVSLTPAIRELQLINCGKLQSDYHPAALKILNICMLQGTTVA